MTYTEGYLEYRTRHRLVGEVGEVETITSLLSPHLGELYTERIIPESCPLRKLILKAEMDMPRCP